MLPWLKRNLDRRQIEQELFERIVAQARLPVFYGDLSVPDTMEGRFEMILLHFSLVLGRLRSEGAAGQRLGQALMERLFASMDDALRQIGVGDMGVPKRVKKSAAAFLERMRDYEQALVAPIVDATESGVGAPSDPLAEAISRHVYVGTADTTRATVPSAATIARYMRTARARLAAQSSDDIFRGRLSFPEVVPAVQK